VSIFTPYYVQCTDIIIERIIVHLILKQNDPKVAKGNDKFVKLSLCLSKHHIMKTKGGWRLKHR
jgi:hypothetical protein